MVIPDGIGGWIPRHAVRSPDTAALIFRDRAVTYSELAERIDRLAAGLRARGVEGGDRIAYLGNNHPSLVEALFAVARIGAVLVPLNTRLARTELEYILADSGSRELIATADLGSLAGAAVAGLPGIGRIRVGSEEGIDERGSGEAYEMVLAGAAPAEPAPTTLEDPALIVYTSGTTGRPKGAVLTHGNLLWNALNVIVDYDLASTERALMISPLFHVASLGMGLLPILLKGGTVLLEERFVASEALAAIERLRPTMISGVPTTFQFLLDSPAWARTDISSLRIVTCGGSAVPSRVLDAYEARGLAFSGGYGLTEAAPGVTMLPARFSRSKAGSAGLPHSFTRYRLAATGEIEVRGPNVFAGYWGDPAKSAEAFTPDGWLRTGDIGRVDEDGFLYIIDRAKDMIISGGENIYSAEVEAALLDLDGVVEAAVIGVPHETWGEAPHAVVVLADDGALDTESMVALLSSSLARYKVPRTLEIVDRLPRTASGKVQKQVLRERFAAQS